MEVQMIGFVSERRVFSEGDRVKFKYLGLVLTGVVIEQDNQGVRIKLDQPMVFTTMIMKNKWFGRHEIVSEEAKLLSELLLSSYCVYPIDAEM